MKKFYLPILTAVLLVLAGAVSAQTYNSITSNPTNLTFGSAAFWVGGVAPPAYCNNCTINVYASVTMDPADATDIKITNGTVNTYGPITLTINTYVELFNSTVTIGNDATTASGVILNDQISLNSPSSIRLANNNTYINSNNDDGNTIHGFYQDIGNPGNYSAGIYQPVSPAQGGYNYTAVLTGYGIGSAQMGGNFPQYYLNCNGNGNSGFPNDCASGLVWGPAVTQNPDPAHPLSGTVFVGSTTLPVELVQFLASKNPDGSVKVLWATALELNAGKYEVERSSDQSGFVKIGEVAAKGNSTSTTNYVYTDRSPLSGTSFYRLKMIDLDGKFKYSPVAFVSTEADNTPLVVYSNPFVDQIRVKVNVIRSQTLTITVSDILGKSYIRQTYNATAGDNLINLVPSRASSGMYVLKIHGADYDQSVKMLKQ